jgi:hypothetical protein
MRVREKNFVKKLLLRKLMRIIFLALTNLSDRQSSSVAEI